jgi:hypothetical protein
MSCERCGGLKVAERFYGTDATVPAWTCDGYRCINCGAILYEPFSVIERRMAYRYERETR